MQDSGFRLFAKVLEGVPFKDEIEIDAGKTSKVAV